MSARIASRLRSAGAPIGRENLCASVPKPIPPHETPGSRPIRRDHSRRGPQGRRFGEGKDIPRQRSSGIAGRRSSVRDGPGVGGPLPQPPLFGTVQAVDHGGSYLAADEVHPSPLRGEARQGSFGPGCGRIAPEACRHAVQRQPRPWASSRHVQPCQGMGDDAPEHQPCGADPSFYRVQAPKVPQPGGILPTVRRRRRTGSV